VRRAGLPGKAKKAKKIERPFCTAHEHHDYLLILIVIKTKEHYCQDKFQTYAVSFSGFGYKVLKFAADLV
jgi:hypothetical protein